MKDLREQTHLDRSGIGAFPSNAKLIICVFSGSHVGSKWQLLCSLLHPTTKHLSHLGDNLVYPCSGFETMADCWQLTQGGSVLTRPCQSTIVGVGLACVTYLWPESENGLIWESANDLGGFKKKKHWVDFCHYRVVVYTHVQHTFMFKHHVKVNFDFDLPFKLVTRLTDLYIKKVAVKTFTLLPKKLF